jgi:hypothetical protein
LRASFVILRILRILQILQILYCHSGTNFSTAILEPFSAKHNSLSSMILTGKRGASSPAEAEKKKPDSKATPTEEIGS